MLNAQAIREALYQHQIDDPHCDLEQLAVEVVAETGSTNADLMARARELASPHLLVAERQTAGRGRAGRTWHSVEGGVLTFSLAWHFHKPAQELMGLPLAVGVLLAERLLAIGVPVSLKWPNDLLKDGKKLAGILLESQASARQGTWAVIGIGLNLSVPTALEERIGQAVADAPWLAQMDRNLLLAQLVHSLVKGLTVFEQVGFTHFVDSWNRLHAFANRPVAIIEQGEIRQQGLALGVDERGCLLLQTANGVLAIHSGDVADASLRALS